MKFHFQCGRILGQVGDEIYLCTYRQGHEGECQPDLKAMIDRYNEARRQVEEAFRAASL